MVLLVYVHVILVFIGLIYLERWLDLKKKGKEHEELSLSRPRSAGRGSERQSQ